MKIMMGLYANGVAFQEVLMGPQFAQRQAYAAGGFKGNASLNHCADSFEKLLKAAVFGPSVFMQWLC